MQTPGTLLLVATPIGNLADISPRAAESLTAAAVIYCEDTRHSRQLLTHLEIKGKSLVSLHEHNELHRSAAVLEQLAAGKTVAVISDAGMPVISDPGQRLVAAVAEQGYPVTAIPGPNAAIMALAISGLPSERFSFEGFLPARGAERRQRIEQLAANPETTIIYESPHRLAKTVAALAAVSREDRRIVITRELTKLHEEIWRGTLHEAIRYLESTPARGEYTLVLEGVATEPDEVSDATIAEALAARQTGASSRRDAIDQVAAELNVPRKRVYAISLIKNGD